MGVVTAIIVGALALAGGQAYAASQASKGKGGETPKMPAEPKKEDAQKVAEERQKRMAAARARNETIVTNPLGLGVSSNGKANIARKSLTGV